MFNLPGALDVYIHQDILESIYSVEGRTHAIGQVVRGHLAQLPAKSALLGNLLQSAFPYIFGSDADADRPGDVGIVE